jgi:ribose/xylose/arabinose/galactoside ABC-type transport system permease subunit
MSADSPSSSSASSFDLRRWLIKAGPFLGLIAVYTLFASLAFEHFVSWSNTSIMLQQTAVIGVGAIGMTLIIISGGVDLSFGSLIALSSVVIALLLQAGWPPLAAAFAGVGIGALAGLVTSTLITRLKLMPFIVTLGMMLILRGAAKGLAKEQPIYPPDETWLNTLMQLGISDQPTGIWVSLNNLTFGVLWHIIHLPLGVKLMLGLAVIASLMLRYTKFGRHIFAIGSSEATARLCGIRVERTKLYIYIVGGAFAGLSGLLQFAYLTGGDPTTAVGLELNIIAAVVIGGASLAGGSGTILGTIIGALIMTVVNNGCNKLGLSNWIQEIVTGAIIIAAVTLDQVRRKTRS